MALNLKGLSEVTKIYNIDDIEHHIIVCFIKANDINLLNSCFLIDYINSKSINDTLYKTIEKYNIKTIKDLEQSLELLIPSCDRIINGAFFTPQYIVDYIIKEINPGYHEKVIDPSCGCGAFLIGICDFYKSQYDKKIKDTVKENLFGADILSYNITRTKLILMLYALINNEVLLEDDFNIFNTDSLKHKWNLQSFDAVIGNPPYVRMQDLDDETRVYLAQNWSTTVKGAYNLYFAFFELGFNLLNKTGRLGFITPNNYFTSLAGEPLRTFFQNNRNIYKIVDFGSVKVFDAMTYTAITFLNKNTNVHILYDIIPDKATPVSFLKKIDFSKNTYTSLNQKKWRLLKQDVFKLVHNVESIGKPLSEVFDISVGLATLKDEIYSINLLEEDDDYIYALKYGHKIKFEKTILKPLVKISSIKIEDDLHNNKRYIIFPYDVADNKATIIEEDHFKQEYPYTYKYLLSVRSTLESRDKGKKILTPFYSYGRTQGLKKTGVKILTPTFSQYPRFIFDKNPDSFFTNGYALYFKERSNSLFDETILLGLEENVDVLLKILNSDLMNEYIKNTSVSISGGYPCYQKNFIEKFTLPILDQSQIDTLRKLSNKNAIQQFIYKIFNLSE